MKVWRPSARAGTSLRRAGVLALLLAVSVTWTPGPRAQGTDDLKTMLDRMQRLERDIRGLNLQLSRGAPAAAPKTAVRAPSAAPAGDGSGPAVARLNVRLGALEEDLRTATGAMEDLGFQIGGIGKRLDKLVADVDYRLSTLENRAFDQAPPQAQAQGRPPGRPPGSPRIGAAPGPPPVWKVAPGAPAGFARPPGTLGQVSQSTVAAVAPPQADKPAGPAAAAATRPPPPRIRPAPAAPTAPPPAAEPEASSVLPEGSIKEQYQYAFGLLRQANYDQAELALQEFVKRHPKEQLASNARYWLGETYYVRAAYVQAAEVFLEGYQADPKGPKAPDSLLKLGMSLAGLDKKREACAAFEKLIKDFPKVSAGVKNTVAREKQKNGCS